MARVILFGGGDGGGIRITPNGIEPIPPFDPALRLQLRALNALVRAASIMPVRESTRHLGGPVGKLTSAILAQLEAVVGEIDADTGLVFQDADGGFTCGSTGKPPVPFPWPVDPRLTVERLVAQNVLSVPALTFLEQAARQKLDVFTVARDPKAAAEKIGVSLSAEVEQSIRALGIDKDKLSGAADQEAIDFYKKVVADGRFIADWAVSPASVAERLKVQVSQEAIDRIVASRDIGQTQPGGELMSPAAVAVAVAIVIVLWDREAELPVLDRSGLRKL